MKKKPKINNIFIKVKNKKGKVKKVRKLNDYIKFKQDSINDNNAQDNNENEENNYTEQELIKNSSSYYYFNYLNNI